MLIQMNPRVSAEFTARRRPGAAGDRGGHRQGGSCSRAPRACRWSTSRSLLEGTREEVLERALPFREGEEVHVEIVEPHMYSPGDAVAKIDGYMISIVGGGPYVGEKHLVRIEEAGRTAAVASLVDVLERCRRRTLGRRSATSDGDDGLESKPRRRGRRGGRRRSGAKAEVGASRQPSSE